MAGVTKNKINIVAKDFGLKSKELIDICNDAGVEGKTTTSVVEDNEMSVLLDFLTKKSEIEDADSYLYDKTAKTAEKNIEKPKVEEKIKATKVVKKNLENKEDKIINKEDIKVEKSTLEEELSTIEAKTIYTPVKQTEKIEVKNVEEPKKVEEVKIISEVKNVEVSVATEIRNPKEASVDEVKNVDESKPKPQLHLSNQNNNRPRPQSDRPNNFNNQARPPFQPRPQNAGTFANNNSTNTNTTIAQGTAPNHLIPNTNRFQGQRPAVTTTTRPPFTPGQRPPFVAGQKPPFNSNPRPFTPREGSNNGSFKPQGTFNNEVKFTKDGFINTATNKNNTQQSGYNKYSKDKKPVGQKFGVPKDDDESQSVRQPSLRPIYDKDGRARSRYATDKNATQTVPSPALVNDDGSVRLLDIRGNDVDLSKYDDRLEKLVPESVVKERTEQRTKKNQTKSTGGRINRNESAARDIVTPYQGGRYNNKRNVRNRPTRNFVPEQEVAKKFTGPIVIPEELMISDLAAKLKITTGEVIKKLLMMGLSMDSVGANKYVDYDTAYLVADEMGITAEKEVVVSIEEKLFSQDEEDENPNDLKSRSPVVVVMGHVDHGKTSLLDAIRHTHVTTVEAGGITQHIGAYRVSINDREITFLDTPGHEAFTAMRARGAQVTDIAVLVVAADDGIMPQTIEAINHAKAAGVSIIVAINKMDKAGANPDGIKQNLSTYDLVPEEWGGDTICVPVSALKKEGISELLEMVLLVADMKELKANPNKKAKGIVIEAKLDRGRGPVASILVQDGTLRSGDIVIAGTAIGRVRAMCNDKGEIIRQAGPSVPVEITGLSEVPEAGNEFRAVEDEKMAKALVEKRKNQEKEDVFKANAKVSLDALFEQISDGVKELAIIVKADVQGSAEAVKSSLEKLSNDEIKVKVIHSGVGGIKESDVMLADASNAIIVGFNVRPDKGAMDSADRQGVDIRTYRIIYECIEEITAAINGMLAPEFKEVVLGHAEVRQTIHVPNIGFVAGSYVQDGKITRAAKIRVVRDGIVIFEDKIDSLRRFKDDVKEVNQGFECGISLDKFDDIKENDILEAFIMEEIKREIKVDN